MRMTSDIVEWDGLQSQIATKSPYLHGSWVPSADIDVLRMC